MGHIQLAGNPPIEVQVKRSARARRLSLRVSSLDGRVTLTMPNRAPAQLGHDFVLEKAQWLREQVGKQATPVVVGFDMAIPVEGALCTVKPGQGRSVRLDGDTLWVPGAPDRVGTRVKTFLKGRARDRLAEASDKYAQRLGRPYDRLTLRDTRSRWGSCTHDGGLMYSWRLVMAWPDVLDYVAAHEVAHLAEMNHSPAFWAKVEQLYGDWQPARKWLQSHGHELHRYRFDVD